MNRRDTETQRAALLLALSLSAAAVPASAQQRAAPTDDVDVEVPARAATQPTPTPAQAPSQEPPRASNDELVRALQQRLDRLEARLAEAERRSATTAQATPPTPPTTTTTTPAQSTRDEAPRYAAIGASVVQTTTARPDAYSVLDPVGLVLSGFVQAQYETSQLSQDQLVQGMALNRDRFVLRRSRLRVDGSWRWFAMAFELDANTVRGPVVGVRRAEATFLWRNSGNRAVPWLAVTAGVTEPAFGAELGEGVRRRWFMERTTGSLAFFGGEADIGVRAWGGVGALRYALGVFNGVPLDDRGVQSGLRGIDPSRHLDLSGRFGVDTSAASRSWSVTAGVSFLAGSGFHPGDDGTKPSVEWRDNNQNSMIDAGELVAIAGRAPTPSFTFGRWAVNADVALRVRTRAGTTRVFAEATMATNLDRGVLAPDPIATGYDVRQLHGVAGFTQEITQYGIVGFRWDIYNANSDLFEERRGALEPKNQSVHTLSPLVGLTWPGYARLVFQYDIVLDALARDARGIPTDLANNQATVRVQGDF
ncbi:MAG: hypothetical protein JNK05_21850 [Myxococcales bacterium]|nr:hypothetical protein [Myxococcales bacterium]